MLAAVFLMQSVARLLVDGLSLRVLEATSHRWDLRSDSGREMQELVVDQVWRWTGAIGIIPAAIAIIMRLTFPKTPRYYAGIMKDLRKAVKNILMVYYKSITEKVSEPAQKTVAGRQNSAEDEDSYWYEWYVGSWKYVIGEKTERRTLGLISLLWDLMDVCFYGLSMDHSNDLAIVAHDPTKDTEVCQDNPLWNPDWWKCSPSIYSVLKVNSQRFIWIASLPSVVGGGAAVLVINRFRRKHLLAATFILFSILLAVAGASLTTTSNTGKPHLVTEVIYAILSFVFNLGPNTLVFIMAVEIFPYCLQRHVLRHCSCDGEGRGRGDSRDCRPHCQPGGSVGHKTSRLHTTNAGVCGTLMVLARGPDAEEAKSQRSFW